MTVKQLAMRWLAHQKLYAKAKTYKGYAHSVRLIAGDFGHRRVESLNERNLDAFVHRLKQRDLAPGSINVHLRSFKALLNFGEKHSLIERVPVKVQLLRVTRRRTKKLLTKDDIEKLLSVAGPRERVLLSVLGSTGIRLDEALHLRWYDLDSGRLSLRVSAKDGWTPKNHQERTVYVPEKALLLMLEYRALQQFQSEEDWVFQSSVRPGRRLTNAFIVLRKVFRDAGIYTKGELAHELRRAAASMMLANGVDIRTVQEVLGHQDVTTTQLYLFTDDERKREAANRGLI